MSKRALLSVLFLYIAVCLFFIFRLPPLPFEAQFFHYITQGAMPPWIGESGSDTTLIVLRLVSFLFFIASLFFYHRISGNYLKKESDRYFALMLFMVVPGMVVAALTFNTVSITLAFVLASLLAIVQKRVFLALALFAPIFFVGHSSILYFGAVTIYAVVKKEKILLFGTLLFLLLALLFHRVIDVSGKPSGHLLELLGHYATFFSPLLFLYLFYVIYRGFLEEEKSVLWYVASISFLLSLLLSLRQKIEIVDFAPYVSVGLVLVVHQYFRSLRVRLPQYRQSYYLLMGAVLLLMGVTDTILLLRPFQD